MNLTVPHGTTSPCPSVDHDLRHTLSTDAKLTPFRQSSPGQCRPLTSPTALDLSSNVSRQSISVTGISADFYMDIVVPELHKINSGVARNLIWGVYVLSSHCSFKTCVNVPHVNKTVTDLGGGYIPIYPRLYAPED